ncbi:MAG: hypothetical protein SO014_03240 [Candidatus Limivicinus sp.]|nr:hypothetical protein [Clostridiales bacterium]MDY3859644.1 hypothetical protein [Candidatus Limivicinus sp.]
MEKDGEGNAYISALAPPDGSAWLKVANFPVSSLFITVRTSDSPG